MALYTPKGKKTLLFTLSLTKSYYSDGFIFGTEIQFGFRGKAFICNQ